MGEPTDASTTSTSTSTPTITITVEFTGGLEMLFDNIPFHHVKLPAKNTQGQVVTIGDLIPWLCENLMKDTRKELFVLDGNVRPGILVLINEADWELEGEDKYELKDGDNVLFVSTLHGG
ncbi:Ubiquitin-related modifier 1 [Exophiala xenobiotica]|uniref:Ubiquitin-related modifier 1 n=1 Tax=Lithohypha guttulata TaxID=1690604 RepID=A0ABR0K1G8_9EURO|nr:Ubiquitin-related modifier 1 [Lithohypha guttulata]KAK5311959.1 Ubiquitin-related modifier 1 [Exophiala xenobiotica]